MKVVLLKVVTVLLIIQALPTSKAQNQTEECTAEELPATDPCGSSSNGTTTTTTPSPECAALPICRKTSRGSSNSPIDPCTRTGYFLSMRCTEYYYCVNFGGTFYQYRYKCPSSANGSSRYFDVATERCIDCRPQ